jgi:hypothetical protein
VEQIADGTPTTGRVDDELTYGEGFPCPAKRTNIRKRLPSIAPKDSARFGFRAQSRHSGAAGTI